MKEGEKKGLFLVVLFIADTKNSFRIRYKQIYISIMRYAFIPRLKRLIICTRCRGCRVNMQFRSDFIKQYQMNTLYSINKFS